MFPLGYFLVHGRGVVVSWMFSLLYLVLKYKMNPAGFKKNNLLVPLQVISPFDPYETSNVSQKRIALWFMHSGREVRIRKYNPCLHRDSHGIGRNSCPICSALPEYY